jgi:hypothetical protein
MLQQSNQRAPARNVQIGARSLMPHAMLRSLERPAIYARREFTEAGGLMSYGYSFAELYP